MPIPGTVTLSQMLVCVEPPGALSKDCWNEPAFWLGRSLVPHDPMDRAFEVARQRRAPHGSSLHFYVLHPRTKKIAIWRFGVWPDITHPATCPDPYDLGCLGLSLQSRPKTRAEWRPRAPRARRRQRALLGAR